MLKKSEPNRSQKKRATKGQLGEGDPWPNFELESDEGQTVRSKDLRGSWAVVYFYPKDNTPGCTREAVAFNESLVKLAKAGAKVFGVSKDSVKSHCGFRDKYGLRFPLLSDPNLALHQAVGAYGDKMMYGKKIKGTIRSTFLVAPDGRIAREWRNVKVDGHADAVLEALAELGGAKKR
jgi:peroxiredoxin Q/BCP